jgi:ubiquinone/menaquinone biosynthesis C-methylase UbiE
LNHEDHVNLIWNGIPEGGVWADFGAGSGAFTLALRELAGPDVEIWSIDRDASALRAQREAFDRQFPNSKLHTTTADFTKPLALPPLDGILAANAIHFVRDQVLLLGDWRAYLKPGGRIVLVEYDTDTGNSWVPHPVSFASLANLARDAGYSPPELLAVHPSRYHNRMYAAVLGVRG